MYAWKKYYVYVFESSAIENLKDINSEFTTLFHLKHLVGISRIYS